MFTKIQGGQMPPLPSPNDVPDQREKDKDNDNRETTREHRSEVGGKRAGASDRICLPRRPTNRRWTVYKGHKTKNRSGISNVWHTGQNVEIKKSIYKNQGEDIWCPRHSGATIWIRMLVSAKRR